MSDPFPPLEINLHDTWSSVINRHGFRASHAPAFCGAKCRARDVHVCSGHTAVRRGSVERSDGRLRAAVEHRAIGRRDGRAWPLIIRGNTGYVMNLKNLRVYITYVRTPCQISERYAMQCNTTYVDARRPVRHLLVPLPGPKCSFWPIFPRRIDIAMQRDDALACLSSEWHV